MLKPAMIFHQVRADPVRVYFPRRSLQHLSVKNVAETIARATPTGKKSSPILGICLPTVLLENVAHKPMIQQFLSNVPITFVSTAYKLCPDIFAAEKSSYTDDDNGGLDRSTLAGVRSGSPGPHPHLLGTC